MKFTYQSSIRTLLACAALTLLGAGCAATDSSAPTHRWASSEVVDEARYRNDHARCQSEAKLGDARTLDAAGPEFTAYKQCMSRSGYELTAYRD